MTLERAPIPMVVVIGRDAVVGRVLELLLRSSNSNVRFLTEPIIEELESLGNAQVLLLAPGLDAERRKSFLRTIGESPSMSAVPILELGSDTEGTVRQTNPVVRFVPWPCRAEELQRQIQTALDSIHADTDKSVESHELHCK